MEYADDNEFCKFKNHFSTENSSIENNKIKDQIQINDQTGLKKQKRRKKGKKNHKNSKGEDKKEKKQKESIPLHSLI